MTENENFKLQMNKELQLNQSQNNNFGQNNDYNQHQNQPFNNIQEPLINNENIQINLNQKGMPSSYQSQNNIEDKTNQPNALPLIPPLKEEQNNQNFIQNNNIQQNIEINQNINGNFQNTDNALQIQTRKNICRQKCTRYDFVAAFLGIAGGVGLFLYTMPDW